MLLGLNVNLICPVTDRPTRISNKFLEDGTRVRISKLSGAVIPKPEEALKTRRMPVQDKGGRDTDEEEVWKVTFNGR